ncbi:MAG: formate/nitrite transporter family protein [Ruminococcus sp.]|nr:formate/nitrite transporter family protein [Ruminococcus sp.]MCM1382604.1 formate/nitrite transporter family protein [Muribaculaceae bacterium]MCM1481006.1 formate/nitrite transporter family protein [Muribaculaceae bacterium]
MKKFTNTLLRAILTGFAIGIGGAVYLSCDSKYLGAFLFGTGLFVILSFGFNLFTGKVGYAVENKPAYIIDLLIIWLGNLIGTSAMGGMLLLTRISGIGEKAAEMCAVKLSDTVPSILILSFFCGMLMFIAADGFKTSENPVAKVLMVFLPVMVFILSGYEHCVANMFYFTVGGAWSAKAFGYLLLMSLGNALGGMFIPLVRKGFVK